MQQWVLSLPIPLPVPLAAQPKLVTPVLQVVQRVIARHLLDAAGLNADKGRSGAVTRTQRFGCAANLNIHCHGLLLDGVHRCVADAVPQFVEMGSPIDDEVHALLRTIIGSLMKMLTRRDVLVEDMGQTHLAEPDADGDEARALRPLHAAAITYRIALGQRDRRPAPCPLAVVLRVRAAGLNPAAAAPCVVSPRMREADASRRQKTAGRRLADRAIAIT